MQETHSYETNINLEADELYQPIDKILENKLVKYYKNRCLANGFVLKILEIEKRSPVFMHKTSLDGNAIVNVKFKYLAQVFTRGSIIVGAEIKKIEQGNRILCKYENTIIYLQADRNFNISEGTVIVSIKSVKYPTGKNMVVVIGEPYKPEKTLVFSVVPQKISSSEIEILEKQFQEISELEKTLDNLDSKLRDYFINLFFKNIKTLKIDSKNLELKASESSEPIVVYRELGFTRKIMETDKNTILKMKKPDVNVRIQAQYLFNAYSNYLEDYRKLINLIINCCEIYKTDSERQKSKMLFHYYENL